MWESIFFPLQQRQFLVPLRPILPIGNFGALHGQNCKELSELVESSWPGMDWQMTEVAYFEAGDAAVFWSFVPPTNESFSSVWEAW